MTYNELIEKQQVLSNQIFHLQAERERLGREFCENHPWNEHKGKKCRIIGKPTRYYDGTIRPWQSDEFFFDRLKYTPWGVAIYGWPVKKDGTPSKRSINYSYTTDDYNIEILD